MSTAIFSDPQDQGPQGLHNFGDTIVVRIRLTKGIWAIFGKVVIGNSDGDAQNANATLFAKDASLTLDRTDVRIAGNSESQSLSLLGTFDAGGDDFVHISCATYNGTAWEAQLIAISVDSAHGSNGRG